MLWGLFLAFFAIYWAVKTVMVLTGLYGPTAFDVVVAFIQSSLLFIVLFTHNHYRGWS